MTKSPRQYAIVKVMERQKEWLRNNGHNNSPLLTDELFVFLGEIPNMPEHCVVAGFSSGAVLSGIHLDNFEEVSQEDV